MKIDSSGDCCLDSLCLQLSKCSICKSVLEAITYRDWTYIICATICEYPNNSSVLWKPYLIKNALYFCGKIFLQITPYKKIRYILFQQSRAFKYTKLELFNHIIEFKLGKCLHFIVAGDKQILGKTYQRVFVRYLARSVDCIFRSVQNRPMTQGVC